MDRSSRILLSVEDLARRLRKKPATIRSDLSRNPSGLPPRCCLPGTRRLLWREEDVAVWLEQHVVGAPPSALLSERRETTRPRGRPTKLEQARRHSGRAK